MIIKEMSQKTVRIAAIADTHCNEEKSKMLRALFQEAGAQADLLCLCGDVTDSGLAAEAEILANALSGAVKVPVVAVLGNHDYESGAQNKVREILTEQAGVCLLDGNMCERSGIGFVGIKGFGGGFGRYQLQSWGERVLKNFVQEAVDQSLHLGRALSQAKFPVIVALMHYSPIRTTVEGESCEIFPFLGSSHLELPIDQYGVNYVFHGHAHNGTPEGKTSKGVPVFNVSMPMLQKRFPDRAPFRLIEVALPGPREAHADDTAF